MDAGLLGALGISEIEYAARSGKHRGGDAQRSFTLGRHCLTHLSSTETVATNPGEHFLSVGSQSLTEFLLRRTWQLGNS